MNSNQSFILLLIAVILKQKFLFISLASKRRDTSFRTRQVEVVDTPAEQLTVDSLLTPSE